MAASVCGLVEGAVFVDNFNATDSSDVNSEIATRSAGSDLSLKWDVFLDPAQNSYYSIANNQLVYTGPTGGSTHPDKLFLVNENNGARRNFSADLAGKQYEIAFNVSTTGADSTDSIGFTLYDVASGAGNGALSVRQLLSRSQVDVVENGSASRYDDWSAGVNNRIRIAVDETGSGNAYEVFVNDVSVQDGTFTVGSTDRYVYMQIVDGDRDGSAVIDDFSITVIPEPATMGLFTMAAAALLLLRKLRY